MASDEKAQGKRLKISHAQQVTMLEVLGASLVLGTCMVISLFLIKYINFNTKIISAKSEAISAYDQTLRNVGVCVDKDRNGKLSDSEIDNCQPNEVKLEDVSGSLRDKVLTTMAVNEELESVARGRNENCYDEDGKRIDFNKLYAESTDEEKRREYLQSAKICSALRVIPDALPAQMNTEALMASLNQLFILSGREPERLSPRDDLVSSDAEGVEVIPVSLAVEGTGAEVVSTLDKIERSIRQFDMTSATIEWTTRGISLQASANAYYLSPMDGLETTKTIYASEKARNAK